MADMLPSSIELRIDSVPAPYRQALEEMLVRHPAAGRLLLRRTLATLGEVRRWMPMLSNYVSAIPQLR